MSIQLSFNPIGNVAYGKTARQSGQYANYAPDYGVDGVLGSSPGDGNANCAHPDNDDGEAAWFVVDLGSIHRIFNVTLFNTYDLGGMFPSFDI